MDEWHQFFGASHWQHPQETGASDEEDSEDQVVYQHESEREQLRSMYRQRAEDATENTMQRDHQSRPTQHHGVSAAGLPPVSGAVTPGAQSVFTPSFADQGPMSPPFEADHSNASDSTRKDIHDSFGDFDVPFQEMEEAGADTNREDGWEFHGSRGNHGSLSGWENEEEEGGEDAEGADEWEFQGRRGDGGSIPRWESQVAARPKHDSVDMPAFSSGRSWPVPSPPPPSGRRNQKGKEKAKFTIRTVKTSTPLRQGGGPLSIARRLQEMAGGVDGGLPATPESSGVSAVGGGYASVQVSQDHGSFAGGGADVPVARRLNAMMSAEAFRTPVQKTRDARGAAQQQKTPLSLQQKLLERLRASSPESPALQAPAAIEDIGDPDDADLTPGTSGHDGRSWETSRSGQSLSRTPSTTPKITALLRDRTQGLEVAEDDYPCASRGGANLAVLLQRALAAQKNQRTQFSRGIQTGFFPSRTEESVDVRVTSVTCEAHLKKCEAIIIRPPKGRESETSEKCFVYFSSKRNPDLDVDIGANVRIHPPWNEVTVPSTGCKVFLCTYNSQLLPPPLQLT